MSGRLLNVGAKITMYRRAPGTPQGFVNSNPQFFSGLTNGIEITDLRCQIKVEKSVDAEPNQAEITITNLSEHTRTDLVRKPLTVRIDAGFDGNLRHLFIGDLRHGWTEQDHADIETKLQLADGDRAWRYAHVNRSYKKGTPLATILKDAAASAGLIVDAKILASPELQQQVAMGYVLQGPTRDELTRLLRPLGFSWSVQDGRFQLLTDTSTRADQAIVVSEANGMHGSPEWTTPDQAGKPAALKVKMALYPELTPGGRIQVLSRDTNGMFRIEKVTHTVDTMGQDHMSEIEAKPSP